MLIAMLEKLTSPISCSENENPETFAVIELWVYDMNRSLIAPETLCSLDKGRSCFLFRIFDVYLLAHKLRLRSLANFAMGISDRGLAGNHLLPQVGNSAEFYWRATPG
jgi:hypothetical protein